jgi:hypothetical protein
VSVFTLDARGTVIPKRGSGSNVVVVVVIAAGAAPAGKEAMRDRGERSSVEMSPLGEAFV